MVIPCYNEEEVLPETARQLLEKMQSLMTAGKITEKSRIVFVNDGSKDRTWDCPEVSRGKSDLSGILRNRGHQNARWQG
ncbi:MAG: glycosyltransferase [Ruminococcus callidus]